MTTLIPRSAWQSLSTDNIFNIMDDFFSGPLTSKESFARNSFRMDIKEDADRYTVEAELPGIKKEEINLAMFEGRLKINIEKSEEVKEERDNYLHRERRSSSMQRSVYLADAAGDGIEAGLNDGILTITVPKKQKEEAQKIEIK
jgi:Molecular chaperone (small heat shock protein)